MPYFHFDYKSNSIFEDLKNMSSPSFWAEEIRKMAVESIKTRIKDNPRFHEQQEYRMTPIEYALYSSVTAEGAALLLQNGAALPADAIERTVPTPNTIQGPRGVGCFDKYSEALKFIVQNGGGNNRVFNTAAIKKALEIEAEALESGSDGKPVLLSLIHFMLYDLKLECDLPTNAISKCIPETMGHWHLDETLPLIKENLRFIAERGGCNNSEENTKALEKALNLVTYNQVHAKNLIQFLLNDLKLKIKFESLSPNSQEIIRCYYPEGLVASDSSQQQNTKSVSSGSSPNSLFSSLRVQKETSDNNAAMIPELIQSQLQR